MNNGINQILANYHEKRLSHAFLIETDNQEQCLIDLKNILCQLNCEQEYKPLCTSCNLCHLIQTEQIPSLKMIRPDGLTIKKDQVLELKQCFSTKPVFSKFNMYIIMNAEKLNASSANTLLKFLEEPEAGIIGFFITNNKENMIDTIKSRCQIILNLYQNQMSQNDEIEHLAIQYLVNVHSYSELTLKENKNFMNINNLSKNTYQLLFQSMLNIYYELYKSVIQFEDLPKKYSELKFLLKRDANYFLKQLKLVEALEQELSYNVNINLLMDRFILETRS